VNSLTEQMIKPGKISLCGKVIEPEGGFFTTRKDRKWQERKPNPVGPCQEQYA
jgi:hypothetical protein